MFTALLATVLGIPAAGFAGAAAWPAVLAFLAKVGITGTAATQIAGVAVPIIKGATKSAIRNAVSKPMDEETAKRVRAARDRHFHEDFP